MNKLAIAAVALLAVSPAAAADNAWYVERFSGHSCVALTQLDDKLAYHVNGGDGTIAEPKDMIARFEAIGANTFELDREPQMEVWAARISDAGKATEWTFYRGLEACQRGTQQAAIPAKASVTVLSVAPAKESNEQHPKRKTQFHHVHSYRHHHYQFDDRHDTPTEDFHLTNNAPPSER